MFKTLLFVISLKSVLCGNILYICPMASPSHHIWNSALALALVEKGHNVTLVDPDRHKGPNPANFSHILLEGVYEAFAASFSFNMNNMADLGMTDMMWGYQDWCIFGCNKSLDTQGIQTLLNYPPDFKFDLIIIDLTAGSCVYPVMHRFNYPPTIAVTAFLLPTYVSFSFGNHLFPAYIPSYAMPYSTSMTFSERVVNYLYTQIDTAARYIRQYKVEHEVAKSVFGEDIPPMDKLERHISLVLTNTDPILDHPQPLTPNLISVGGLHTRKSKKLPEELQTIMDNAKNGVIVFSLGTNIRSDKLTPPTQRALLDAFSKIKETVIWKFESEMEDLPKNVIVRKWLPQNDLLGHPNVKLFIGHGGALSTQEAIFHGVPMICVPFMIDQHLNTKTVTKKKLGVSLDFRSITADYVLEKLKEVLDNPLYTDNIRKVSSIFKDRMETPMERAVFWADYVLRHGGADFLNSPARDLPFYVAMSLDVVTFLLVTLFVVLLILYKLTVLILSLVSKKKKVKVN